jgi:hypothetical protein
MSLPFFLFHLKRLVRLQPVLFAVALSSFVLLALAASAYGHQWLRANAASQELRELLVANQSIRAAARPQTVSSPAKPTLPPFSSAEFVQTINEVVHDIGLPVDEISYLLEDGPSLPYLRYRVTLSVTASYPLTRRFVDQMAMNFPNAVLDAISCSREDTALPALECDLSFSAFFRKGEHG